jgi:polar amino acid transport system substrate-binding protein
MRRRARVSAFALASVAAIASVSTVAQAGTRGSAASSSPGPLVAAGTIHYCSDISSPPLEFFKNGTTATGSDIAIGDAIAAKLKLKAVWVNTAFSGIIPSLEANHCDAIISELFDKPARRKVVSFVDYMFSASAILVRAGNPLHISGLAGLCGRHAAAETGTTIVDFFTAESKKCKAQGKSAISVQTFLRDSDAVEQLGLGHVDAYGTTVETGAYDMSQNRGKFQFAGKPFSPIPAGIAVRKNDPQLLNAIKGAFAAIRSNGTYKSIMAKWGLTGDMIK